jgi:hypothetical protein
VAPRPFDAHLRAQRRSLRGRLSTQELADLELDGGSALAAWRRLPLQEPGLSRGGCGCAERDAHAEPALNDCREAEARSMRYAR